MKDNIYPPGFLTRELLRESVLNYIDLYPGISHRDLLLKLEANFQDATQEVLLLAVSEAIQDHGLVRLEYSLKHQPTRRDTIYFPAQTKIHLE